MTPRMDEECERTDRDARHEDPDGPQRNRQKLEQGVSKDECQQCGKKDIPKALPDAGATFPGVPEPQVDEYQRRKN